MKTIVFMLLILSVVFIFLNCEQEELYTFLEENAKPEKVYIFSDGTTSNGNLGGRSGADSTCQSVYNSNFSGNFHASKVKALISVSAGDQVKDLLPLKWWDIPVVGVHLSTKAETGLQSSWGELWSIPGIIVSLQIATGLGSTQWTGSTGEGVAVPQTCLGWTSGVNVDAGVTGNPGVTTAFWMEQNTESCDLLKPLVCMAY